MIFTLSFLWYPTVALVIALAVGIFVSGCTGKIKEKSILNYGVKYFASENRHLGVDLTKFAK